MFLDHILHRLFSRLAHLLCAHLSAFVRNNQAWWQQISQNLMYKLFSRFSKVYYTPKKCEIQTHQN